MEKENFNDFNEKDNGSFVKEMKMPKTKEGVDSLMKELCKTAKKMGKDINDEQIETMRKSLIRKIEIEQDNNFLRSIFHAASALSGTLNDSHKKYGLPSADAIAHMLTTTLTLMEEEGLITIHVKKLK